MPNNSQPNQSNVKLCPTNYGLSFRSCSAIQKVFFSLDNKEQGVDNFSKGELPVYFNSAKVKKGLPPAEPARKAALVKFGPYAGERPLDFTSVKVKKDLPPAEPAIVYFLTAPILKMKEEEGLLDRFRVELPVYFNKESAKSVFATTYGISLYRLFLTFLEKVTLLLPDLNLLSIVYFLVLEVYFFLPRLTGVPRQQLQPLIFGYFGTWAALLFVFFLYYMTSLFTEMYRTRRIFRLADSDFYKLFLYEFHCHHYFLLILYLLFKIYYKLLFLMPMFGEMFMCCRATLTVMWLAMLLGMMLGYLVFVCMIIKLVLVSHFKFFITLSWYAFFQPLFFLYSLCHTKELIKSG